MTLPVIIASNQDREIEVLRKELAEYGIALEKNIHKSKNGTEIEYLTFDIPHRYNNERGAGRKEKYITPNQIEAIKEQMKEKTADEVAKEYGISRRTLFRKIKEHDEKSVDSAKIKKGTH